MTSAMHSKICSLCTRKLVQRLIWAPVSLPLLPSYSSCGPLELYDSENAENDCQMVGKGAHIASVTHVQTFTPKSETLTESK